MTGLRPRVRSHALACAAFTIVWLCASSTHAQTPAPTPSAAVAQLADFDAAKRTAAARALRRMPDTEAAAALFAAVVKGRDEYVRYPAFVLFSALGDPRMPDVVRAALTDRNDRLRESAYAWLERHPDPSLVDTLLAAIETEPGEFVRPAMLRAVSMLDANERVRVTLTREVERGLDIYRSAVIEALGDRRAEYAVDAIAVAARQDGPLQDDAVLALGKIGGEKASAVLASITTKNTVLTHQIGVARCLSRGDCATERALLARELTMPSSPQMTSVAASALALLAGRGDTAALSALAAANAAPGDARRMAAIGLGSASLKDPLGLLKWLVARTPEIRDTTTVMLHDAFDRLEADLDEERFFAVIRGAYWQAPEGSDTRTVAAALIDRLEF